MITRSMPTLSRTEWLALGFAESAGLLVGPRDRYFRAVLTTAELRRRAGVSIGWCVDTERQGFVDLETGHEIPDHEMEAIITCKVGVGLWGMLTFEHGFPERFAERVIDSVEYDMVCFESSLKETESSLDDETYVWACVECSENVRMLGRAAVARAAALHKSRHFTEFRRSVWERASELAG